jgi:hypothetical protein
MRVLKPINTPTHHFPAGAVITPEDLDGPLTVADWQRLGHLETPAAAKPAKPAPAAPTDAAPREGD